jgi:hypothetical protein
MYYMPRIASVLESCIEAVIADIKLKYSRNFNLKSILISLLEADLRNNFINLLLNKYKGPSRVFFRRNLIINSISNLI